MRRGLVCVRRPFVPELFFFIGPAPPRLYPLSLHDALPISFPFCRRRERYGSRLGVAESIGSASTISPPRRLRSEERRVGKECGCVWARAQFKQNTPMKARGCSWRTATRTLRLRCWLHGHAR